MNFDALKRRLNGNEPLKAVIEAGRNWGMMYDLLEEIGIDTTVAHPLKVRAIADAKIKHDSIDARTLAHLLRADLVPEVHVPPKDIREQKNLLRHRFWLVKLQTMTKNRIRQIIDRNHVRTPDVTDDNLYVTILDTLPGFGKIFSALAALEIDNINRFPTKAKFASYCGLIPSTFASGGKVYHGNLIPTGNRWLKYVFIEASWPAIRTSNYCRAYFNRIKYRKDGNVAIVALARRLSEIAYKCLKEKRYYEERPYIPYTR